MLLKTKNGSFRITNLGETSQPQVREIFQIVLLADHVRDDDGQERWQDVRVKVGKISPGQLDDEIAQSFPAAPGLEHRRHRLGDGLEDEGLLRLLRQEFHDGQGHHGFFVSVPGGQLHGFGAEVDHAVHVEDEAVGVVFHQLLHAFGGAQPPFRVFLVNVAFTELFLWR